MFAKMLAQLNAFINAEPLTEKKRPPGPSLFETLESFKGGDVFISLEYPLQLMRKYGGFCRFPIGRKAYLVTGPKEMEEILKTNAQQFTKNNFLYRRLNILFGKSLLVTDGTEWRQRRKISQPAFQASILKNYAPIMTDLSQAFMQDLITKTKNNTKAKAEPYKVDLLALMNHLTFKIAFKLFCNETLNDKFLEKLGKGSYFGNWYMTHSLFVHPCKPTLPNLRFYYYNAQIDRALLAIIAKRRQQFQHLLTDPAQAEDPLAGNNLNNNINDTKEPNDVLQMLLKAKNENDNAYLSDAEILPEFKTLILTGFETTAAGLSWMWYLLAKYPEYRVLLETELAEVLGGRFPTMEDLPKLNMLRAIVCETFRLYPPIWSVMRTNSEETSVGGYSIPAKSLFLLNFFSLHRNPEYWENPMEFYPLRFLGENLKKQHAFAYLPFSTGNRICIANHFAMVETMLLAATIAQKLRFNLVSKLQVLPEPCISLRPKGNLWMTVKPR